MFTNSFTQQIWHTTNRGQTWTDVSGDLPDGLVLSGMVPNPRPHERVVRRQRGRHVAHDERRRELGALEQRHAPGAIISDLTYQDQTTTTGAFYVVAGTLRPFGVEARRRR